MDPPSPRANGEDEDGLGLDQSHSESAPASPMSVSYLDADPKESMDCTTASIDTSMQSSLASPSSHTTSHLTEESQRLLKIVNDPSANSQIRLTYSVAQEMNSRKLWRFYLSEEEHEIFEAALVSVEIWQSFISLDPTFQSRIDAQNPEPSQEHHAIESSEHIEGDAPLPSLDSPRNGGVSIKQEPIDRDQDQLCSDLASATIKKEDSFSTSETSLSVPSTIVMNGRLHSPHHTPNYDRAPSPLRLSSSSQLPKESTPVPPQETSQPEYTPVPASVPTTAFRVRVMVFEQLLPTLYPKHRGCCHPTVNVAELESKGFKPIPTTLHPKSSPSTSSSKRKIVEEDDYDDEGESTEKQAESSNDAAQRRSKPILEAPADVPEPKSKNPDFGVFNNLCTDRTIARTNYSYFLYLVSITEDHPLRLPIHHLYYTLEYDMDAMHEQQQLEASDNIQEQQETQAGSSLLTDNMLTQLGAGSISMKYLLSAIDSNRAATGLSDRELRTLLSDVRPNRSKWANEDKVGQEELYEGCERVLMELRNYTEHSTPFLNKVNKREAPDYFQVIKHPMDLGTVLKKLKSFAYQSKTQFANDLYLIYSNCLLYNSDPSSVYRKHAVAMKKKTQQLLETVQDVVIRDRAEVEAEAEESDDEGENSGTRPNEASKGLGRKEHSSGKTIGVNGDSSKSKKDHVKGAVAVPLGSETPKMAMDLDSMQTNTPTREASREPSTMDSIETPLLGSGLFDRPGLGVRGTTPNGIQSSPARQRRMSRTSVPVEIDLEQEEREIAAELNASRGDILFQEWKERTKKARAKICSTRETQQLLPFEDQLALVRSPWEMKKSNDIEQAHDRVFDALTHKKRKQRNRAGFGRGESSKKESDSDSWEDCYGESESSEDEDEEDFVRDLFAPPKLKEEDLVKKKKTPEIFLPEYSIRAGLPEVPVLNNSASRIDLEATRKLFDEAEIQV